MKIRLAIFLFATYLLGAHIAMARSDRAGLLHPVVSADGTVTVFAKGAEQLQMRAPVLSFVNRVKQELSQAIHKDLGSQELPIRIVLGSETNGATNVYCRIASNGRTQIDLPAPDSCDLDAFRVALVRAYCCLLARTNTFPLWRAEGLSRTIERAQINGEREVLIYATRDFEAVWNRWTSGDLPPVQELLSGKEVDTSVAAVLTRWLLFGRYKRLTLEEFTSDWDTYLPLGVSDRNENLDLIWENWLLRTAASVFDLGVLTKEALARWEMDLLVWPLDEGYPVTDPWKPRSLQWLAERVESPAVKRAAKRRAITVCVPAMGRGKTFSDLAEGYSAWFQAIASGISPSEAQDKLTELEGRRKALEAKLLRAPLIER